MKTNSAKPARALKVFGLILTLGALPLLATLNGCATGSQYEQSTAERNEDQNTSSLVKYALSGDTEYKFDAVNVDTFKGTVQLSGFVTSRDQKLRAGDLARKVNGARQVVNNLLVKESAN